MNNKQKKIAVATLPSAVAADIIVGGLGIGLLGTAVAVPAAAIVTAVGFVAYLAAGDETSDTKSIVRPVAETTANTSEMQSFLLKKGTVTHKISVNKERGWGQTCLQASTDASWTNYRYFGDIQEMRDLYKKLINKGYQPA